MSNLVLISIRLSLLLNLHINLWVKPLIFSHLHSIAPCNAFSCVCFYNRASKHLMKLSHIHTTSPMSTDLVQRGVLWQTAAFCPPTLREFWHMRFTTFSEANESVGCTINLQDEGRGCLVQSDWQWPIFHHDTHITKWIIKVFNLMVILEIKRGNVEGKGGNNSVIDCL